MGKIVRVKKPTFRPTTLRHKVVLNISCLCINNSRRAAKCFQCAISIPGVQSVSREEDMMAVTFVGIDSAKLILLLRRKMGYEADDKSTSQTWILRWILPFGGCGNFKHAQDKPLLRRRNHNQNDGSLSPPEAKQKRTGLIPEDENTEENERVSKALIESEHPNSMLCEQNFSGEDKALLCKLTVEISEQRQEIRSLKNTVNQLMALLQQQCQVSQPFLPNTTDAVRFYSVNVYYST